MPMARPSKAGGRGGRAMGEREPAQERGVVRGDVAASDIGTDDLTDLLFEREAGQRFIDPGGGFGRQFRRELGRNGGLGRRYGHRPELRYRPNSEQYRALAGASY